MFAHGPVPNLFRCSRFEFLVKVNLIIIAEIHLQAEHSIIFVNMMKCPECHTKRDYLYSYYAHCSNDKK